MTKTIGKKRDTSKFDDPAPKEHDSEDVEQALKETFPAYDPASYSPGTATPSNIKDKDKEKKKTSSGPRGRTALNAISCVEFIAPR